MLVLMILHVALATSTELTHFGSALRLRHFRVGVQIKGIIFLTVDNFLLQLLIWWRTVSDSEAIITSATLTAGLLLLPVQVLFGALNGMLNVSHLKEHSFTLLNGMILLLHIILRSLRMHLCDFDLGVGSSHFWRRAPIKMLSLMV